MTDITPQQIRELAGEFENDREDRQQILTAIRTAADQLDASVSHAHIRRVIKEWWLENEANEDALIARILNADTDTDEEYGRPADADSAQLSAFELMRSDTKAAKAWRAANHEEQP